MAGWLKDVVRPNLAPTTVKNYEMFTRLYILPDPGKRRLDRLGVREVQARVNDRPSGPPTMPTTG